MSLPTISEVHRDPERHLKVDLFRHLANPPHHGMLLKCKVNKQTYQGILKVDEKPDCMQKSR